MKRWTLVSLTGCMLALGLNAAAEAEPAAKPQADTGKGAVVTNPVVAMKTSMGEIEIELFADKAPLSAANFLKYLESGFYEGTVFHRVIDGFMIQGGGMKADLSRKPTLAPIKNEADNGLKNLRGTLAMARTNVVDSATSQFFINLVDNAFLDHGGRDFGYAVFGKVVKGMDVVEKIGKVKTGVSQGMKDVPVEPVAIETVTRKGAD
ncbi:MAG: Peptidyl-prolyl cis-trans isomerase A precursor [Lentisphaerae bacterium ADurb.BinA184]|nr:MAG: Peptidyl-prolyl cis-trans isomerase A precursor [Lentisphaerae bacterium ADurb.BinA184]